LSNGNGVGEGVGEGVGVGVGLGVGVGVFVGVGVGVALGVGVGVFVGIGVGVFVGVGVGVGIFVTGGFVTGGLVTGGFVTTGGGHHIQVLPPAPQFPPLGDQELEPLQDVFNMLDALHTPPAGVQVSVGGGVFVGVGAGGRATHL